MTRTRYLLIVILVIVVGLGALGGRSWATADQGGQTGMITAAEVIAQAPKARLAVYVRGGANIGNFDVPRHVGIHGVSNPANGIYCIAPATGIKASYIVPQVATEYSLTPQLDRFAQWASVRTTCPPGNIQVETFDLGDHAANNEVAFTVTVD